MKTTVNLKHLALIALLGGLLAAPAMAQPGAGMGMGGGPGMQGGPGGGYGMGMGGGRGGRAMRFNQDTTPGWALMSADERVAHREKMLSLKTYEECRSFQTEHRTLMETRAREQGKTLPLPRQNACDRMRGRGLIK